MFNNLEKYENDPIEAMFVRLMGDTHPDKIDLGIGVFRDESGEAPVMRSVRTAEQQLIDRKLPKSYMSPLGNLDYCADIEQLALGSDHPVLQESRIVSAQTPGAGSALRAGAEFVRSIAPQARVWVSEPVWGHQLEFFEKAGVEIKTYRYYDQLTSSLQFAEMLEDLQDVHRDDLILLHGCCHNPTGQDLNIEQWQDVANLVIEKGAVPFVDVAYQGFGEGIEEDVAGLRLLAAKVPQMLLTVSSSKSFGIYRERAGLLSVIFQAGSADRHNIQRRLRDTVRQLYFMAPNHGAALVHEIMSTPELESMWRSELDEIRAHVVSMRGALQETMEQFNPGLDASFLTRQHGMFSCLPITFDEQLFLEQEFHIYMLPPARVNVAAMNARQSSTLAQAYAALNKLRDEAQKAS
jgi:aspartate aminotransferase